MHHVTVRACVRASAQTWMSLHIASVSLHIAPTANNSWYMFGDNKHKEWERVFNSYAQVCWWRRRGGTQRKRGGRERHRNRRQRGREREEGRERREGKKSESERERVCRGERDGDRERRSDGEKERLREREKGRRESEREESDSRSERKRERKRDNDGESQREKIARAFACVCMLSSHQHTRKCTHALAHALTHARTRALTHARTHARTQPEYFLAEEQLSGLTSSLRLGASDTSLNTQHCMHTYTNVHAYADKFMYALDCRRG